jgi:hypothetical protein
MNLKIRTRFFICVCLVCQFASALETDQFTVPPAPLADLAPQLSAHVRRSLQKVIDEANDRHADLARAASQAQWDLLRDIFNDRAAEKLRADYIAEQVYNALGQGLPECTIESWLARADMGVHPARMEISCDDSIYGKFWQRPLTMQELSPTVNIYGVYLGTDKIGHLFQQGYEYYKIYRQEEFRGRSPAQATSETVKLGIFQEKGVYGLAMVGVYSNGDLAGNFAGLKFYLNLTRPITINGELLPPILVVRNDQWEINKQAGSVFLKPFITDRLNEALNPCEYAWLYRDHIRASIESRGRQWAAFYHTTRQKEALRVHELSTWFGEDYGHSNFKNVFTADQLCFSETRPEAQVAAYHRAAGQ